VNRFSVGGSVAVNRLAVLSNANGGGGRRRRRVMRVLDATAGVTHVVTHSVDEVPAALDALLAARPAALAVHGGDGTLQTLLTEWTRRDDGAALPPLAVLPGGTTNMSARDLSGPGGLLRQLRGYLALRDVPPERWRTVDRPALAVVSADGERHAGLFLGLGAVVRGVELWQRALRRRARAGDWGVSVAVARAAWGLMRRHPAYAAPVQVGIAIDGGAVEGADVSALMVTALRGLVLGMRPYWGKGAGPLACTWMEERAARPALHLPRALWGRGGRIPPDAGFHSRSATRVRLDVDAPWLLDGEVLPAAGPLELEATPPLRFVLLGGARR
jgi:diacylglycerol kinase (ATP)